MKRLFNDLCRRHQWLPLVLTLALLLAVGYIEVGV